MNKKKMNELFKKWGYIRTGGSKEELQVAKEIKEYVNNLGVECELESFKVQGYKMQEEKLYIDGKEINCKGYRNTINANLKAPLYYLVNIDNYSLSECEGKIVIFTGYLSKKLYNELVKAKAVGFISTNGNLNENDYDIDEREIRGSLFEYTNTKLPGVNINIKDAEKILANNPKEAQIIIKGKEEKLDSHNVVAYIKGESDKEIVFTAHYDSVYLAPGVYDNLSGSIGILEILERMLKTKHHYSLRFVWCGCEERGLLGSKHYSENHDMENVLLCINLDMIGTTLGKPIGVCTSDIKLVHYLEYFGQINGYPISVSQGVYSSDSTPFADMGTPAISFARIAPNDGLIVHNRHDVMKHMNMDRMMEDVYFIYEFANTMANAKCLPVKREIPEEMKKKIDEYFLRDKK